MNEAQLEGKGGSARGEWSRWGWGYKCEGKRDGAGTSSQDVWYEDAEG
jgi:hypothetical protein